MLTPVILALTKLRQKDDCEIEASLEFMVSSRLGWAAELRSFLKKKKEKEICQCQQKELTFCLF